MRDMPFFFALSNQTKCSAAQTCSAFANCLYPTLAEFRTQHDPDHPDTNKLHTYMRNLQSAFTNASSQ